MVNDPIRLDTTSLCSTDDVARIHQSNEQQSLTIHIYVFDLFSQIAQVFTHQPQIELWQRMLDIPQIYCSFFPRTASFALDFTEFQQ